MVSSAAGNTGAANSTGNTGNTGTAGGGDSHPPVIVPNVFHKDAGVAKQLIEQAGLVAQFTGTGDKVSHQSPGAGQSVPLGSNVTMTLYYPEPNCGPHPC